MNIRRLAESDLKFTLEDDVFGFGWDVILTNPAGFSSTDLKAKANDISEMFDPDTGELVSGRVAIAVFRISSLIEQGFDTLPADVPLSASKPWLVAFDDINGNPYLFKVVKSFPDRTLGVVKCQLTAYRTT